MTGCWQCVCETPETFDSCYARFLRIVAGHAERTGITGPGYPERAVYKLVLPGGTEVHGLFVYEDGEFVPTGDWYARQEEQ